VKRAQTAFPANRHIIVGGLGFIGSNLVNELILAGQKCLIIDNEYLGSLKNLGPVKTNTDFDLIIGDAAERNVWNLAAEWSENSGVLIWHLAANSDIAAGSSSSLSDIHNTLMTSVMLSESIRNLECKGLVFASSSAVYGELNSEIGFVENQQCLPQSYYGMSKLASEHLLGITLSRAQIPYWIFRFANIVGSPATHGVIYDLILKLIENPVSLEVLGDGKQCKTYLNVAELILMMINLVSSSNTGIWNLGPGDVGISVAEIAQLVVDHAAPEAILNFGEEDRGWLGDVPKARMNCSKLEAVIGNGHLSSGNAVHSAVHAISVQLGVNFICPSA